MRKWVNGVLLALCLAVAPTWAAPPAGAVGAQPTVVVSPADCGGNYSITVDNGAGTDKWEVIPRWGNETWAGSATALPGKQVVLSAVSDGLQPAGPGGYSLTMNLYLRPQGGAEVLAGTYTLLRRCGYQSVSPTRLLDTRGDGGPVAGGASRVVQVAGRAGLPASGVRAVVVNVTGTEPTSATYVSAYPAGQPRPTASTLNLVAGQTRANLAVVALSTTGRLALFNNAGSTHLVVDLVGWYPVDDDTAAITPTRVLDTRTGAGAIAGGTSRVLGLAGTAVPADAGAVIVNVTGTRPSTATYVTAYPAGTDRPLASTLNLAPGETAANLAIVKIGAGRQISFYNNSGATDVVVDVVGWLPKVSEYTPLAPTRLLDTRTAGGPVPGGAARVIWVRGFAGVPSSGVAAVVVNLTGTQATRNTYVTAYPTGEQRPLASNLNLVPGETAPNLAVVRVGADGAIALYNNNGDAHLVVDVVGYLTHAQVQGKTYTWGGANATPTRDLEAFGARGVAAGLRATYALRWDGTVLSWGSNESGQLGRVCTPTCESRQVQNLDQVKQIAAGGDTGFALTGDGSVYAWGYGGTGEFGYPAECGSTFGCVSALPRRFTNLPEIARIAAAGRDQVGRATAYAVSRDGALFAWGSNHGDAGAPAVGSNAGDGKRCVLPDTDCRITTPTQVPLPPVADVTTDGTRTHALLRDGTVWSFGSGLGDTPQPVPGLTGVTRLYQTSTNTYAQKADGTVLGWGDNDAGTLGNGTRCAPTAQPAHCGTTTPTPIPALTGIQSLAGDGFRNTGATPGTGHTVATSRTGEVVAWGANTAGELGTGRAGTDCATAYTEANACFAATPAPVNPVLRAIGPVGATPTGGYAMTERYREF